MNSHPISLFFRLSRPVFLLGGALQYFLGLGIADFLGITLDMNIAMLGLFLVLSIQLSTQYLNEYYDAPLDQYNENRTLFTGGSGVLGDDDENKLPRSVAQYAAVITLTAAAILAFYLLRSNALSPAAGVILVLAFLGSFFYSVPPVRLSFSGYGELTTSIIVANLVPIFAFLLQTGETHRLLAMATFPLTFLHMAMLVAFALPDYGVDMKYRKTNLAVRMGWENAMNFHNIFILAGFAVLGLATSFGLPSGIALPAFLPLILGLLQIWYMRRIASGLKPNWRALTLSAVILFASTSYLLAFAFWTR